MQPLIPPTPNDLTAAQLRLMNAKDQDDSCQSDLRAARADATQAKKELKQALRGWRDLLRQIDHMPDDGFAMAMDVDDPVDVCQTCGYADFTHEAGCIGVVIEPDEPDPNEEQPRDLEQLLDSATEPVPPGRRRR